MPGHIKRKPRSRARRILTTSLVAVAGAAVIGSGGAWLVAEHYAGQVTRIPNAFPGEHGLDPVKGGKTFLLAGLDTRSDEPTTGTAAAAPVWTEGEQRSDTIMLIHFTQNWDHVYVVSIPRDSLVSIPGHKKDKINAAYSWGGPALLVDTLQQLTKVPLDHMALVDWDGFRTLIDAVGGIDVQVAKHVKGWAWEPSWEPGRHHLNGEQALKYARQRFTLPRGDIDRTARQQNVVRAVLQKTLGSASLANPVKTAELLDALTKSFSVDSRMSNSELQKLAWTTRNLRTRDMTFLNAPISGFGKPGAEDYVYLDQEKCAELWTAMKNDELGKYLADEKSADTLNEKVA